MPFCKWAMVRAQFALLYGECFTKAGYSLKLFNRSPHTEFLTVADTTNIAFRALTP